MPSTAEPRAISKDPEQAKEFTTERRTIVALRANLVATELRSLAKAALQLW